MLINYIGAYLVFIILVSIVVTYLVWRLNFREPIKLVAIIMAIILSPLVLGYLYIAYFSPIPETTVPHLAGMPLEEALEELESLGLKGRFTGTVFDMKYPEGSVVTQRPEAGRRVKEGRVIRLVTSSGRRKVIIPNLLGRPLLQAKAVLAAKGLNLGEVKEDFMPELDPSIILFQSPLPGEEKTADSYVDITVSTTVEPVPTGEAEAEEEGGFRFWW